MIGLSGLIICWIVFSCVVYLVGAMITREEKQKEQEVLRVKQN